jgi:hypothetical protein
VDAGVAAILGALSGAALTQVLTLLGERIRQSREDRRHFFDARRDAYGSFVLTGNECVQKASWIFDVFYNLVESASEYSGRADSHSEMGETTSDHSSIDEDEKDPGEHFDVRRVFLNYGLDSEEVDTNIKEFYEAFREVEKAVVQIELLGSLRIQDVTAHFHEGLEYVFGAVLRLGFTGTAVAGHHNKEAWDIIEPIVHIDWRLAAELLEEDLDKFRSIAREDLGVASRSRWGKLDRGRPRGSRSPSPPPEAA